MKQFLLAILSGALLGAPFIAPLLWPLALVGLAPLLLAITSPAISRKRAFVLGMFTGLVLYGIALWAIFWSVLPLDWLGIFDLPFQLVLVTVGWFMTVLGFALWTGIFALVYSRISNNSWHDILTASALWIITEYVGAWWFSIQNLGPGSIAGPHFALAFIGNVLAADSALVQIAWVGGVYALSAIVVATGAVVYRVVHGEGQERRMIGIIAFTSLAIWLVGHIILAQLPDQGGGQRIRIAAISTQEPAAFTSTPRQGAARLELIRSFLPKTRGADIVAFPEGSDFLTLMREPAPAKMKPALRSLYAETTLPVFIDSGSAYSSNGTLRSRAEAYDIAAGVSEFQDKRFLLPDGEYVPTYVRAWVSAVGRGEALNAILDQHGLTPGDDVRPLTAASTSIGVLFCNEAMSPVLYRSLARQGAGVFVNVASHGWFHGSRLVANQMLNVAIIRAVESRRWYVQASNVAPSFALDPYGRIATSSVWGTTGVIEVSVETRNDATPYGYLGPWAVWLAASALLVIFVPRRKRMR